MEEDHAMSSFVKESLFLEIWTMAVDAADRYATRTYIGT
jgi:hypothetical protein